MLVSRCATHCYNQQGGREGGRAREREGGRVGERKGGREGGREGGTYLGQNKFKDHGSRLALSLNFRGGKEGLFKGRIYNGHQPLPHETHEQ